MGILNGNPKNEPLHYGEVFGAWSYLVSKNGLIAGYSTLANHVGDKDLKSLLQDIIRGAKQEKEKVEDLLKVSGVALPPASPEKPVANSEAIPVGARFTDPEIAAMLARDNALCLAACSQMMGQSVREDIGAMFLGFHTNATQTGLRILRMNKEKGWIIPPPLHVDAPELIPV